MSEILSLFPCQTASAVQPVLQALHISPRSRAQTQHPMSMFSEMICLPLMSKQDLTNLDTYRSQRDKTQSPIEEISGSCSYHIGSFQGRVERFPLGRSDLVSAQALIACPASAVRDGHGSYQNVGIKRRNRGPKWVQWNGDIQTCNPQLNVVSIEICPQKGGTSTLFDRPVVCNSRFWGIPSWKIRSKELHGTVIVSLSQE